MLQNHNNHKKNVKVYILAGGLGTRLSGITKDIPKPMAEISGIPFLEWQIKWLKKNGFDNIVLLVGYKKDKIIQYFGDGEKLQVNLEYSIEDELLGTGGAIIKAIKEFHSEYFVAINGDTFFNIDLNWFCNYYLENNDKNKDKIFIALKYKSNTKRYGNVSLKDDYIINSFIEKNDSLEDGYINGGIYIGKSDIFKNHSIKKLSMENDIFPELVSKEKLIGIPFGDRFIDIGIPEDYLYAKENLANWFTAKKSKAIFLDRDGVIIEDTGYISKIENVRFIKQTIELVKKANQKNIKVFVITNQAGVAKGYFTEEDSETVNTYINEFYKNNGAHIERFYTCLYHTDAVIEKYKKDSLLRKPNPGMILLAIDEYNLDAINSIMVGDKDSDIIKLPYIHSYLIQGNYDIKNKDNISTLDNVKKIIDTL